MKEVKDHGAPTGYKWVTVGVYRTGEVARLFRYSKTKKRALVILREWSASLAFESVTAKLNPMYRR